MAPLKRSITAQGRLWAHYCVMRESYQDRVPWLYKADERLCEWRNIWFNYLSRQLEVVRDHNARRNRSGG